MPLILSAQVGAKSRKSRYSFEGNQPGVLPQAVTTVWRTELGTTLLIGFNSTTVLSAYFRYLTSTILLESACDARDAKFLPGMALPRGCLASKVLNDDQEERLSTLVRRNTPLVRAWYLKESFYRSGPTSSPGEPRKISGSG
ncbi:MAG: transposase [Acidobacteriia bacterium]|nr:transposase [Terriglobia bacterium]